MYCNINFKTKTALKLALKAGQIIHYFQPGPFTGNEPLNGTIYLEGPHYPEPRQHQWYAQAEVKDGYIVKVK